MFKYIESKNITIFTLVLIFSIGLWIRLIDLKDPPLDFNPTRQLRSAIIARGLYYERAENVDPTKRDIAIDYKRNMERLEPPVLETIVSWIYLAVGKEILWVARILSSICWLVGAAALYDIGRRMTSPFPALVGLLYFLFIPFSIRASRSFQPDPAVVMMVLLTAWSLYRWSYEPNWKWTLISGLVGGLSGYIKPVGLLFSGGMLISLVLYKAFSESTGRGARKISIFRDPKVWTIGGLMVVFVFVYYFLQIGENSTGYLSSWTLISKWRDLLDPSFIIQWMLRIDDLLYLSVVAAGFIGMLIAKSQDCILLLGLWLGYILLGLIFPHHIVTHDYYHLPLIGLVSLSIIPLIEAITEKIKSQKVIVHYVFLGVVLLFFGYNGWIGRSILVGQDYRDHPAFWQKIASVLPEGSKAIGLTQDYGFRLMYYGWRKIDLWSTGEGAENFTKISGDADYFLITAKNQLDMELDQYLEDHFQIYANGVGYLIYDLNAEK